MSVLFRLQAVGIVVPVLYWLTAWQLFLYATPSVVVFVPIPVFRHHQRVVLTHGREHIAQTTIGVIYIIGVIIRTSALENGILMHISIYCHAPTILIGSRATHQHTVWIRAVTNQLTIGVHRVFLYHPCGHRQPIHCN